MKSIIIEFFSKSKLSDPRIPSLDEIVAYTDDQLEWYHDYIQYLFPLPEPSPVNPEAPLITAHVRSTFLENPKLRKNLLEAYTRMAAFYGYHVTTVWNGTAADVSSRRRDDWEQRANTTWRKPMDHNHLRITRIIRCLRILGLDNVASSFHADLCGDAAGRVSKRSLEFWERAAKRGLWLPPHEADDAARGIEWLRN